MKPIFQTENFSIRKLKWTDFEAFHEMQGNAKVMKYVRGVPMSYDQNSIELKNLIASYDLPDNDFWIFAAERRVDKTFVGTVALVKSEAHGEATSTDTLVLNIKEDQCEIGYRLRECFWGKGYALEIARGLVTYAKNMGFRRLIACVADANVASYKILKALDFQYIEHFTSRELQIIEQKLALDL